MMRITTMSRTGIYSLAACYVLAVSAPAWAGTRVTIPSQPVGSALAELARQTRANLIFAPETVADIRSVPIDGDYTAEQAARKIIAGKRLRVIRNPDGSLVITRIAHVTDSRDAAPVVPPAPVRRQPVAAPAEAAQQVADIVVTARRRAESIQSVPVTVTALGSEALEAASFRDMTEVTRLSPGLVFSGEGGKYNSNITLRGLGKIANATGTPAVVVYFNEVPLHGQSLSIPAYDLANVQVLKGPQGTLFGRNTIGGAILVTPELPKYEVEGYIRGGLGNLEYRALEGAINLPLVEDRIAVRLAGQIRRREGYVRDLTNNIDLENVHQDSFRASVLLEPVDGFKNVTVFDTYRSSDNNAAFILFRLNRIAGLEFLDPVLDEAFAQQQELGIRRTRTALPDPFAKVKTWGIGNTTTLELGDISIKNVFGYRVNKLQVRANTDGLPTIFNGGVVLYNTIGTNSDDRQISNELQVIGTALDGKLDFILGGFYLKAQPNGSWGTGSQSFDFFGSAPLQISSSYLWLTSKALFGQISYDLSSLAEGFKINAGLRYTWTNQKLCGINNSSPAGLFDAISPKDCQALSTLITGKENKPSWTIGLDYQASDDVFLYVTSRRGVREGGINSPLFNSPNTTGDPDGPGPIQGVDLRPYQTYKPEQVTDIELGAKTRWRMGDVTGHFNLALFRNWYKGAVQYINVRGFITQDSAFPARSIFGFNAGELTLSGVEVDTSVSPTRDLKLSFTGSYLDQKVDRINTVNPFPVPTITLPSPEFSLTAALDYRLPFAPLDGDLDFHFDYFWTDDTGVQGTTIAGYDLANMRLDWRDIGGTAISAGAFMRNVFDKEYIQAPVVILRQFPINTVNYGEPRNYGIELSFRF